MTVNNNFDVKSMFLIALSVLVPVLVIVLPLLTFLSYSFFTVENREIIYEFSLNNYVSLFSNEAYRSVFSKTIFLAFQVTVMNVILGYIVAFVIWRSKIQIKSLLMIAVAIPLLLSYVIKIYAIRTLLGYNGLFNNILLWFGAINEPLNFLLFNMNSVKLTLSIVLLPFAILPIYVSLERVSRLLLNASQDLGANGFQTFFRVILPLTKSGIALAATYTFVLSVGDFLVPELVGGVDGFTFGRLIFTQFGLAFNWPLGAAFSVILLLVSLTVVITGQRISKSKWQVNHD